MATIRSLLPFSRSGKEVAISEKSLNPDEMRSLGRSIKIAALALGFRGSSYYYDMRAAFEPSPYDFNRITQASDTDGYVKQAISKYKDLFWKEGWQIVGENPEAVSYLYRRIDYMEIAMKKPFSEFLIELSDQLIKYANVFVVKARADINEYFPDKLNQISGTAPVAGYYLIPTEQTYILRDKQNRPKAYQQATDPLTYSPNDKDPVWAADRVIHMYLDKKPGRAFGTPFLSVVLDDVVALRQMEEDIQNLVHRELFPLYKYIVGTADQPAEPEEISKAAAEIENLRSEGGLILPYRHNVEVIGANNSALDATSYLEHFKERVAVGLGVAPHHLGMVMNGGNRSVTDRLDVALYDKVKQLQKQFAEMVRLYIFNELLFEGGFDPISNPIDVGDSDRCFLKFKEIDVDTQVKKETHIIQKYANNLITSQEARIDLGMDPEVNEDDLYAARQAKVQMDIANNQAKASAQQADQKIKTQADSDKQEPAQKGQRNLPSSRRGPGNSMRPANQYSRNTSPNIRRSEDLGWLSTFENLLEIDYNMVDDKPNEENHVS
jgi:hypothetical protein